MLALGSLMVLGAARWLTPHASGVGTHVQLGLPPCGFLAWLGLPCPACGLTTAFAHLADFELLASLRVHPMGLPLLLLDLWLLAVAIEGLASARSVTGFLDQVQAERIALVLGLALLLTWGVRLLC